MEIIGKTLAEVSPALYDEIIDALERGALSAAAAQIDGPLARRVLENLAHARICGMCECGQEECRSYRFEAPQKSEGSVRRITVRLHARGEHLLHIDDDGDVYRVERLYDLNTQPVTKYERRDDGAWSRVDV